MLSSSLRRPCIGAAKASASTSSVVLATQKSCQRVGVVAVRFAVTTSKGKGVPSGPERSGFRNVNGKKGQKQETYEQRQKNFIKGTRFFGPIPENMLAKVREVEETLAQPLVPSLADMAGLPVIGKDVELNKELVGKATEFSMEANTPLKTFGVPRTAMREFRLLSRPCSIVRKSTVQTIEKLGAAGKSEIVNARWVLTGPAGCGKSYLMMQSVAHCAANGWVVWYIPRASKMIDSTTPYTYDSKTQIYVQTHYAQQSLSRLLAVNKEALSTIPLGRDVELEKRKPISAGTSLAEVAEIGSKEHHHAPALLALVMATLGSQTKYPVLLAIDDLQSLYHKTQYRNQHYERIQSYHLSTPRLLMEYASGKRRFARGAFLGALSLSDTQYPVPVEIHDVLQLSRGKPITPYEQRSPAFLEYLQGLKSLPVPAQLERSEAASVFDVWTANRSLHTYPDDELFLSKFSESGGNARAFVHGGLLASLTT